MPVCRGVHIIVDPRNIYPGCTHLCEQSPGAEDLSASLAVQGLPSLLFVGDGEILHRVEGALTADRIAELVEGVWFGAEMPSGPEYGDQ